MGQKLFDIFSLSHLLGGFLMYNLQFTFLETNVIHIIYEMIDDKFHTDSLLVKVVNRIHKLKGGKKADSLKNNISDHVFFILGFLIGQKLFPKPLYSRKNWYLMLLYPSFGTYGFWKIRQYLKSKGVDPKYM